MKKIFSTCIVFIASILVMQAQNTIDSHSRILPGFSSDVLSVTTHFKNPFILAGSADNSVALYKNDSTFQFVKKLTHQKHPVSVVQFNKLGNSFLSASQGPVDFPVFVYDSVGNKIQQLDGNLARINAAIFDNSGKYVITASDDARMLIFDIKSAKQVRQFVHSSAVNSIAMYNDPRFLIVAGNEPQIKIYNLANGQVARSFIGHQDAVNCIRVSPNGKLLLSGSNDKSARIWDIASGKELRKLPVDCWKVLAVQFSTDSKYCLTGCNDGSIKVWETETGKLVTQINAQNYIVRDIAFSGNVKNVITAPLLREESIFGVRVYPSGIETQSASDSVSFKIKPIQKAAMDSILRVRKLNHTDSIQFQLIQNSSKPINALPAKSSSNKLDSARIYKTPMIKH